VALLLAAASPEVELLAITTVFGNVGVELTTSNALRLRTLAELGHVPVGPGAARPLVQLRAERTGSCHGADGLGGRADLLPEPDGPVNVRGAVALMADLLRSAPALVTLVAIGPLTNVALLLAAHPDVKPWIGRLVVMGGNLRGRPVEFNIHSDPDAARRVLVEEDVPITLVPFDLTQRATIDRIWLSELASAGPRCTTLAEIVQRYQACCRGDTGRDTVALHDSLAVLEAVAPGTLRTAPRQLEVVGGPGPARGIVADAGPGADQRHVVQVAVDADLPAVSATILDRLRSLR
jgi:pyrimidine-specific ribonucleoside hydrolase